MRGQKAFITADISTTGQAQVYLKESLIVLLITPFCYDMSKLLCQPEEF